METFNLGRGRAALTEPDIYLAYHYPTFISRNYDGVMDDPQALHSLCYGFEPGLAHFQHFLKSRPLDLIF